MAGMSAHGVFGQGVCLVGPVQVVQQVLGYVEYYGTF